MNEVVTCALVLIKIDVALLLLIPSNIEHKRIKNRLCQRRHLFQDAEPFVIHQTQILIYFNENPSFPFLERMIK
jgi:hypothetical protein